MTRVVIGLAVCAALLGVGSAGSAWGQGISLKPDEVIAARQGGMALLGGVTDQMKAGVKSGADPKDYVSGAEAMVKWGGAYAALFPDGTQKGHDTKAKPEIWTDRAGFEKADAAFIEASTKLVEAAKSGDKAMFATAFGAAGQSCGGCHRNYKER